MSKLFISVHFTMLTIIAFCLFFILLKDFTPTVYIDESRIIKRVLYCIDEGSIYLDVNLYPDSGDAYGNASGNYRSYCDRPLIER